MEVKSETINRLIKERIKADGSVSAGNNRTLTLSQDEIRQFAPNILAGDENIPQDLTNKTVNGSMLDVCKKIKEHSVDLLFLDPPYNISKMYGDTKFSEQKNAEYIKTFEKWILACLPLLKKTASVYVCSDWKTSAIIQPVLSKYFYVRNRITWERNKGRGSKNNWKNCSEDIWYATVSNDFYFDVDAVKVKRKVVAPYKDENGDAKDWTSDEDGKFRFTCPANFWSDITIPYWSMPENTDHPTQKPEKLVAKVLLASSKENDMVLDPFLGSGTTSVVAKKLNRRYIGIEQEVQYCLYAEKRLKLADSEQGIQGYEDGIFWERNSQPKKGANSTEYLQNLINLGDAEA
ncbi:MAG: site-specific DNA-methyltransferase [Bifidobacteriaceae bacterium]|nr:site-specific DNA-methyltransferase [Bifidobacteriaceae bacterium]